MIDCKYHAYAYNGTAWLTDLGVFDTEDEAADAICAELDRILDTVDEEDRDYTEEVYMFNSRIVEE